MEFRGLHFQVLRGQNKARSVAEERKKKVKNPRFLIELLM